MVWFIQQLDANVCFDWNLSNGDQDKCFAVSSNLLIVNVCVWILCLFLAFSLPPSFNLFDLVFVSFILFLNDTQPTISGYQPRPVPTKELIHCPYLLITHTHLYKHTHQMCLTPESIDFQSISDCQLNCQLNKIKAFSIQLSLHLFPMFAGMKNKFESATHRLMTEQCQHFLTVILLWSWQFWSHSRHTHELKWKKNVRLCSCVCDPHCVCVCRRQ